MTETITASVLDPSEVILEDVVEIRACRSCRARLVLPVQDLGKTVSCSGCGFASRALPNAGPFADVHIERSSAQQPTLDRAHQPTERILAPTLAPFVPVKKQDPIEERSAMVDSIGSLQWLSAFGLVLVALNNFFVYWTATDLTLVRERNIAFVVVSCLLLAVLSVAGEYGIRHRSRLGWGFTLLGSLAIAVAVSFVLYQRSLGSGERFSDFHYGILLSLPSYLCAIITIVILLTPRYLAEFAKVK